jgi:hypothetical protein
MEVVSRFAQIFHSSRLCLSAYQEKHKESRIANSVDQGLRQTCTKRYEGVQKGYKGDTKGAQNGYKGSQKGVPGPARVMRGAGASAPPQALAP